MSRADDVACKIREAAEHPRALLLFAIGAERPTAQSAASVAYALGLSVKEEKLAKWVGVLKRDSEILFGKPFLEALREILKQIGDDNVEVKRGEGFFHAKAVTLLNKLFYDLKGLGITFSSGFGKTLEELGSNCTFENTRNDPKLSITLFKEGERRKRIVDIWFYCNEVRILPLSFVDVGGFKDLGIYISDKRAMKAVRSFGHAWEAKAKQLKGSREVTVTIYQDYAD